MDAEEIIDLSPSDVLKLLHAASLLNRLAADRESMDLLLDLQGLLVRRILARERAIARTRKLEGRLKVSLRKDRLDKAGSKRVKALLQKCGNFIDQSRRWIILWKCFGDGVACAYQSPYNLKMLLYDQDYNVKQEAGFITGKEGFALEWEILEHCVRKGYPVVLSDITNMIRVGDICFLGGVDPLPLEVKTGNASGPRAARQQQLLQEVTSFYRNDGAKQFKGLPNVERHAMPSGPDYRNLMNDCIRQARADGYALVSPEPGLQYVALTAVDQMANLQDLLKPWVLPRILTPSLGWVPCLPFTLTLEPDNLVSFISGKIAVFVLTDMEYLKALFLQHGSHATMIMDGVSAIQVCADPEDLMKGVYRISELHFARVALEFQSLAWFAKENAVNKQPGPATISREEFEALPEGSYCFQIPEAWAGGKDYYAAGRLLMDGV